MNVLLNPGPVNLSERVRAALAGPDLCHREIEFAQLQSGIRDKLLEVYGLSAGEWAAVLLTGSGTAAMEAMLGSIPGKDDKVLIIENGVYGERLTRIAAIHGINHSVMHYDWGQTIDGGELEGILSRGGIKYIAVVHHETTTGRLNDLDAIAVIAERYNVDLLVDGVSSFGAEAMDFEDRRIAACAGTANKCLHGVPGISFVIVNRKHLDKNNAATRSLYLDLATYLKQQDAGGTPFTQSVQTLYALDAALDEHREEGGWRTRRDAYRQRLGTARAGLMALGIEPLLEESASSCVLHAYQLPDGIPYQELHDKLKQDGFIIYAGQGDFAKSIFRISMMGAITMEDVKRFIESVRKIVRSKA
ncbi:MAG: 2-aminoethylphosphonate aminotransferase [Gammaproteobacteria bacterium]